MLLFFLSFTRFERYDFSAEVLELPERNVVNREDVVNTLLKGININKCSGPNGIGGRTLKFCADQLSGVLRHLFKDSIDQLSVPSLWKISTIIPVPKKSTPKQLSDLPPLSL